jgi:hypothetical protein
MTGVAMTYQLCSPPRFWTVSCVPRPSKTWGDRWPPVAETDRAEPGKGGVIRSRCDLPALFSPQVLDDLSRSIGTRQSSPSKQPPFPFGRVFTSDPSSASDEAHES